MATMAPRTELNPNVLSFASLNPGIPYPAGERRIDPSRQPSEQRIRFHLGGVVSSSPARGCACVRIDYGDATR